MSKNRKQFTPNQNILLVSQVGRQCPLCGKKILYKKDKSINRGYENAHIYPLNPTSREKKLLENEEKLSEDPDDIDNIIPLCVECHTKFDNPRTIPEYRKLMSIKKSLILKEKQIELSLQYQIEGQIAEMIDEIKSESHFENLSFSPTSLQNKFNGTMPNIVERKIKYNVSEYFYFIQEQIENRDIQDCFFSKSLLQQVRVFYIQLERQKLSQEKIFDAIVNWFLLKSNSDFREGAEIIASYFVQNCEIFDDNTK